MDHSITGIELGGSYHHKLCLFADDILIFLSSPQVSAPNLMVLLKQYSFISGLTVNIPKSTALNISLTNTEKLAVWKSLPFKWATHSIPYVGIQLTANCLDIFTPNYPTLLKPTTNLLLKWSSILIS